MERLMNAMGLQGVVRGKTVITTNPDTAQPCPDDKVTGSSSPICRTSSGSAISPMSPVGRA
ncbi:hypothetical protein BYZ73_21785 [Rhodovulum viride]|uniref:Uncharacterized protein n=1 Tax=Rhodovulum viride TaxID=1231134 RepID=A0ABX9DC68_9RHOB|nr:hypothetical protein BYZ73_21785 [Rhodovulum viride]